MRGQTYVGRAGAQRWPWPCGRCHLRCRGRHGHSPQSVYIAAVELTHLPPAHASHNVCALNITLLAPP